MINIAPHRGGRWLGSGALLLCCLILEVAVMLIAHFAIRITTIEFSFAGETSTPAGVPAISRGLKRSDTPGRETKNELHPGGVPARWQTTAGFALDSLGNWSEFNGTPAGNGAATPTGSDSIYDITGDVAALNPRLIAATPSGVELARSRPKVQWRLRLANLSNVADSGHEWPASPTPESKTPVEQPPQVLSSDEKAALAEGQALFRGLCSGCHGGMGRGGKGPDLTDDRWLHGNKDEDIARVIKNGVPGTTMKKLGESLKEQQIENIIAYVRSLARAPGDTNWKPYMTGDPVAGQTLFFDEKGKAVCFKCHTVNRKGGHVGPTLDRIAARRSPEFIMESIVSPSKFIDPLFEAVQVATKEGKVLVGLRINETNFSIQLREDNGRFHSFAKRDLEEFRVMDKSMMPDNMAEQLTVKQLHDLFAFLMTLE